MRDYKIEYCPDCKSEKIRETSKEIYCCSCGLVIEDSPFAFESNDSMFSEDFRESKSRFGKPLVYLDATGGNVLPPTMIGYGYEHRFKNNV